MVCRVIVLLGICLYSLMAGVLSYDEFKNEPKSLAKDYYIYRLITTENLSKNELKTLRGEVFRYRGKISSEFDKKLGKKPVFDKCKGVYSKNILDANLTCKLNRLGAKFSSNLDKTTINSLITELSAYPEKVNLLKGIKEPNPAKYFADTMDSKNFFNYFKSLSQKEKMAKFNFALENEFAQNLGNDSYFNTFIIDAVVNRNFPKLRSSLISIDASNFSGEGAFYLGINAVKFDKSNESVKFFKRAKESAKTKEARDKATFWIYLVSEDPKALEEVARSKDLNLYSLYAKELTGNSQIDAVIPNPVKDSVKGYDPTDPFAWVKLREEIKNTPKESLNALADKFDTKNTQGEYIYIKNIASGYPDNFYPTPFLEHLNESSRERQALIFAIARQESRFIQSAVSTSYALGLMQFMPFVANDWAKKHSVKNYDQDDMFKPKMAYKFANIHLDWMENSLYNPVFIAYAYNGGIGFTKRLITRGDLFNAGKFEPFLSMELVYYAESREYAKKVLANYIVYSAVLGVENQPSISEILGNLLVPKLSDKFRN